MKKITSKSLGAAIGLNLLLPGAGYLYMGRWVVGIIGGALVIAICMQSSSENSFLTWLTANLIMAIDMCLLKSKHQAQN